MRRPKEISEATVAFRDTVGRHAALRVMAERARTTRCAASEQEAHREPLNYDAAPSTEERPMSIDGARTRESAKGFYSPGDLGEIDYGRELGDPGSYPFVCGEFASPVPCVTRPSAMPPLPCAAPQRKPLQDFPVFPLLHATTPRFLELDWGRCQTDTRARSARSCAAARRRGIGDGRTKTDSGVLQVDGWRDL